MEAPGRADALSVLAQVHRGIQWIFARMNRAITHEELGALTEAAITELVRLSVAEERYLAPAVRRFLPRGDELADRELAEHAAMERTMRDLERTGVSGDRFLPLLHGLARDVEAYFRDQENRLFPLLVEHIDPVELREMGHRIRCLNGRPAANPPHGTSLIDHTRRHTGRTAES
jgi:hypothetical protein